MTSLLQRSIALLVLIVSFPVFLIIYIGLKLEDGGPFFFVQKRVGKDGQVFEMYKIRTMVEGAEKLRKKYMALNEVDGPTFKIKDDPRFTRVGKVVSKIGIDELPQLINIIKGEMAFIGPRPLPVYEARQVPKKYSKRFSVLPGITSLWAVSGLHELSFDEWMQLDLKYVRKKNIALDLKIVFKTIFLIFSFFLKELVDILKKDI